MLHKSMVRFHLEYAEVPWNLYRKGDHQKSGKGQMRARKLLNSVKHLSYEDRLKRLNYQR